MKILILIVAIFAVVQCNKVKGPAKRAILGHGHVESVHNSIDPNKNAYLPPPIQEYPLEQSHTSVIEQPATTYLPPFETSPGQNGGSQYTSQYRASGYLPPQQNHEIGHISQQPYRSPDYLPPKSIQPSDHNAVIQLPENNHGLHHIENSQPTYSAPGYLPPISAQESHVTGHGQQLSEGSYRAVGYLPPISSQESHITGKVQQPAEGSYRAAGYLPPEHTNVLHQVSHSSHESKSTYSAPGYLPPISAQESHVTGHVQQPAEGSYRAAGYLPPEHTDVLHQTTHSNHGSYNAPGYLPPVHHNPSVSAGVPSSVDFEQPTDSAYKASGYLPPLTSSNSNEQGHTGNQYGQTGQVPHTVYGSPQAHSHTTIHVSPSANTAAVSIGSQYAPSNSYSGYPATSHDSHFSNSAQPNYKDYHHYNQQQNGHHDYHQPAQNHHHHATQNSYSAQTQGYATDYHGTDASYSVTSQSHSIPVPHDYTEPSPMYPSNPTTQYASQVPTYQKNNDYLPPHPENHHAENNGGNYRAPTTVEHTNNGYLPPLSTDYTAHASPGNAIQVATNHIQNSGQESSKQQYASSFPTYSTHSDGYDYTKPTGSVFEDGHQNHHLGPQNSIIPTEPQSNLHVINVGSEGAHEQDIKIIKIIDETQGGAIPNIRILKIIKETVRDEPNNRNVQTLRIISEPSSSSQVSSHVKNPIVQNQVNIVQVPNIPQVAEQHENFQASRAQSSGEYVQGGYLPPTVISQPPVIPQPIAVHVPPPVVPIQPVATAIQPHQAVVHQPIHNQEIPPVPEVRPSTNVPGYLPPLAAPISHNPTSNVKTIRILHDSNYDQQQDAIYAGVAEHNSNDINTIRVIHQQDAATSGRYGYPSPQIKSVKLLRYYRRY